MALTAFELASKEPKGMVTAGTDAAGRRYAGPAYPFGPEPSSVLGQKSSKRVILTSLVNIIMTRKGTLPYAPETGTTWSDLLFEKIVDGVTTQRIREDVLTELQIQEPRAIIVGVDVQIVYDRRYIRITIEGKIPSNSGVDSFTTSLFVGLPQ